MKRFTVAAGLLLTTMLAGCSYTTPIDAAIQPTLVEPVVSTVGASSLIALPGMKGAAAPTTMAVAKPVEVAQAAPTTLFSGGYPAWPTTSGYPAGMMTTGMYPTGAYPMGGYNMPGYTLGGYIGYVPVPVQQPAPAPVPAPVPAPAPAPVMGTPMAVHAGVPTPHGPSNALQYDGYNGVRPFLVQSGAVWNGPSTYMLPVGAQPGTHQHVETVSQGYVTETVHAERVVTHAPAPVAHGHRHASVGTKLSIRKGPGRNHQTCAIIPAGGKTDVYECNGGWCRVNYKGTDGWARQTYLSFLD